MAILEHDDSEKAEDRPNVPHQRLDRRLSAALLATAWLIPLAANAIRADWALPPLLLLGTASLLRVGHTLLDRLVIAAACLAGLLIAAGVLFSFWPWHLSPVPVAGFGLTVLVVTALTIHYRLGRRPRLPRRVRGTDLIIIIAPVVSWILIRRPIHGKAFIQSLAYTAIRHDTMNHYSLYDAIHRVGGYPYFRQNQSAPYVDEMLSYQPGAHYLYAFLDIFRRSTTDPGASIPEFLRYTQYEALGFCLLTVALPWSARWIAGPSVTGWRRTLVVATAASVAVFGQLSTLFWQSFDAEILGLGLLAVALAIVTRPPTSVCEQIFLTATLVTAVAWVYSLYWATLGLAVAATFVVHRRRILRHKDFLIRAAAIVTALCMMPVTFGLAIHPLDQLLTQDGAFVDLSRSASVVFGLMAAAAVLTRVGRRSAVWRISAFTAAGSCFLAFIAELYGHIAVGTAQYYSSKLVDSAWVASICGLGSLALFLDKGDTEPAIGNVTGSKIKAQRGLTSIRSGELARGTLAIALPLAITNGFPMSAHFEQNPVEAQGTSITIIWSRGHITPTWTGDLAAYARIAPLGDGTQTVIAVASVQRDYIMSMVTAALNHQLANMQLTTSPSSEILKRHKSLDIQMPQTGFFDLESLTPGAADRPLTPAYAVDLQQVETWIRTQKPGLRIAVANPAFAALLNTFASAEPQQRLSVVYIPDVPLQ